MADTTLTLSNGREVSLKTIEKALEEYFKEHPEKKKKEARSSFEPIKVDYFTIGLDADGTCDVYVKIQRNDRVITYPISKDEIGCWLNPDEVDDLIHAIQQAKKASHIY